MRPVHITDLTHTARALMCVEPEERVSLATRIMQEADWADRYTKRFHKRHAVWGNGTLAAASAQYKQSVEPTFDDRAYGQCLITALTMLQDR
jgi:hypothetical protein